MKLDESALRLALAAAAYAGDRVRLIDSDLNGFLYIVATRQGLFVVNEKNYKLIVHGLFFGITFRGEEIFLFESCDVPREPTRKGRIVKLVTRHGSIVASSIIVKGLDNGCHQIDFFGPDLYVVDTYRQQLLRFRDGEAEYDVLHPLPRADARKAMASYVHVNSLLAVGNKRLLLLHNGAKEGIKSEIAVFDEAWKMRDRWVVDGTGCHGLALLEDGTILTCGSMEGVLLSSGGLRLPVSPHMTRGLAIGSESLAVGSSHKAQREGRLRNGGTVTFFTREQDGGFRLQAMLDLPGAPTEIRRLDGQDASLSNFLATRSWGQVLNSPRS